MAEDAIIQLYSPHAWHDKQALVVNKAGRKALIKALQECEEKIEAFVCDGEGFDLILKVLPDQEICKLKTPYIADYTHGGEENYPDPRELVDKATLKRGDE